MKPQTILLTEILNDNRYQLRDSSQGKNVAELNRLISDGFELRPITLRKVETGYLIIDGFQRVQAMRLTKGAGASIQAKVCNVNHKTAVVMAAAANQKHGQQLEKSDKKKIAKTLLREFPQKSNVQIADMAFLSEATIRNYRKEMPEAQSETRIGADGREISVPKQKDKPTSKNKDLSPKNEAQLPGSHTEANPLEPSTPVTRKAKPPSADKSSFDKKTSSKDATRPESSPGISHDSSSKTISPKKGNKIKTTSSTSKTKYKEIDFLLGRYRDLIEKMEDAQSFVTQLKGKTKMSKDEHEQLEAFEALVDGMERRLV